jgi:Ca2+-binding EF-hand superfamily protein
MLPENVLRIIKHSQQADREDVTKKAAEIFHMFDVDKNRKLSEAELTRMLHSMHLSHTHAAAHFGNEYVGPTENKLFEDFNHEELAELLFLEVDANGDGHISRKEFLLSCNETGALHDLVKHAVIAELLRFRFD